MKVAVLGAGAIGGWLAAALAEAGVSVSVVARGATLQAIRQHGLRVQRDGRLHHFAVIAGAGHELGVQDFVIVATKAQDVPRALPDLQLLLGPQTAVVSAVNGIPWWFLQDLTGPLRDTTLESVDPGGRIAAAIDAPRSIGCVVHARVSRPEPGLVQVGGVDRLLFGEPSGSASARVQWLVDAFVRAGLPTLSSATIRSDIWSKLWGNMTMNPLSALARASTGRLLEDADVNALCLKMMEEMAACGRTLGLSLPISSAERMNVTRRLGDFKPSMLQDVESGLPLEFAPQLGAIVELAQRQAVPTPFCCGVLGLVRLLSDTLQQSVRPQALSSAGST